MRTGIARSVVLLGLVLVAMGVFSYARSGSPGTVVAHTMAMAAGTPAMGTDAQDQIAVAMNAAPSAISADATIMDFVMDADGKPTVLREGTNDWTCFPDDPSTPDSDPMCLDQMWLDWLTALMTQGTPNTTKFGMAYMLQGGSTASNTDPFATEPAAGEAWVPGPPHVMFLLPGGVSQTGITTDYSTGGPYVMWAGTPYEHIMMPVAHE